MRSATRTAAPKWKPKRFVLPTARTKKNSRVSRQGDAMTEPATGGCNCGNVRYRISGEPKRITICHCTWCQRRTGSAFGVEVVFDDEQIEITGDSLTSYRHISDESGRWLEQHFCANCGSNIGLTLEAVPGIRSMSAGSFDDTSWIEQVRYPRRHVFTRTARSWSEIPKGSECFEMHFRA